MRAHWQRIAAFVIVAVSGCFSPAPVFAQLAGTCTLVSSGNYFVVRVDGDSIARHDTEITVAARVLSEHLKRPGHVVTATRVQTVKAGGCTVSASAVDTVRVVRVDTLTLPPRIDSVRVVDTLYIPGTPPADTGIVVVPPPPPPPPVDTVIVTPPPPPPPVDTVVIPPPVHSTRLLATPERLATWQRMVAENHPWAAMTDSNCKGNRYGDTGLWCAWWYMATGDQVAGRKSVGLWLSLTDPNAGDNERREQFIERAVLYDWFCSSGTGIATPSECATMRSALSKWAQSCNSARTMDGDLVFGCYFGRVAFAYATGDLSDLANIGGLDRTGNNRNTFRNAVGGYFDHLDGGGLGMGSHYDVGTLTLALMGVEVAKSATGVDHFPEFPFLDIGRMYIASTTGDLNQWVQYGDSYNPRDVTGRLWTRMTLWSGIEGVTKDPTLHRLMNDFTAKYPPNGGKSFADPWARAMLFRDPYAPVGQPWWGTWYANGHGMIYNRQPTQTLWLAAYNRAYEDHQPDHLFNAQVYKNGEWVLTNPLGYGGHSYRVTASNGLSLAGLGSMYTSQNTWADSGNGWIAIAGMTSGPVYDPGKYDPPPAFVRYAGRTAVAGNVGATTVVITRDTVDMDDPRTLPKFDRYYPATHSSGHQGWIQDANGLPWTIWHSPVAPTVSGNTLTWTTKGGQPVRVDLLSDQPIQTATYDESVIWGYGTGSVFDSEIGFHVRANTPARVLWSVVQIGPPLPVSRSGDTITIGGSSWTLTTAGVSGP
jgi:hypothetical protein